MYLRVSSRVLLYCRESGSHGELKLKSGVAGTVLNILICLLDQIVSSRVGRG